MDRQAVGNASLVAQYDEIIRQNASHVTAFSCEEQMTELLLSMQAVITKLRHQKDDLQARVHQLSQENEELRRSNRLLTCQRDQARSELVVEHRAKKTLLRDRDSLYHSYAELEQVIQQNPDFPSASSLRSIITRNISHLSQAHHVVSVLDTTDDDLVSDLEFDKSEDDLITDAGSPCGPSLMPLTPQPTPSPCPSVDTVLEDNESSSSLETSCMNTTVILSPAQQEQLHKEDEAAQTAAAVKENDVSPHEKGDSCTTTTTVPSTQLIHLPATATVPAGDEKLASIEIRQHEFKEKKVLMLTTCSGCRRRMFYQCSFRCTSCSATAHPGCRDRVPLPCIPNAAAVAAAAAPTCRRQSDVRLTITDFCPKERPFVPPILVLCLSEIEKRISSATGLPYVRDDELSQAAKVKTLILSSRTSSPDLSSYNVHVLCGAVKFFLKSLDDSLITHTLWKEFAAAVALSHKRDRESALHDAINRLPELNRHTLAALCKHLGTIKKLSTTRLTNEALADVFAMSVVGHSGKTPNPHEMRTEKVAQKNIMLSLLQDVSKSFWAHVLTTGLVVQPPPQSIHTRRIRTSFRRRSTVRGGNAERNASFLTIDENTIS
jgi:Rac GTPase-activating protein 1